MDKKKKFQLDKILYYALLSFFAIVFLVSVIYIGNYLVQSHRSNSAYDDLAHIMESIRNDLTKPTTGTTGATQPSTTPTGSSTVPTNPSTVPTSPSTTPTQPSTGTTTPTTPIVYPTGPNGETMLPEYKLIYGMNTDTVGWITVPDTKINYPVMQTPNNKDYYLKRNFNKLWSDWGAIYAREVCDVNRPSDNVTLYGHHMKDGSMFAGLDKFKQEYFWKTHQTFTFDTLYEHHTYQIWAVFKTSAILNEGFPYHQFSEAANKEEFDQYVATIKSMQFYETGITPQYGDKLLCLSTCEYTLNDGRFVVMAMRIS